MWMFFWLAKKKSNEQKCHCTRGRWWQYSKNCCIRHNSTQCKCMAALNVFRHVHRNDVFTSNCSNYHMSTRISASCCNHCKHVLRSFRMWCFIFVSALPSNVLFTCRFDDELPWFSIIIAAFSTKLVGECYETLRFVSESTGIAFLSQRNRQALSGNMFMFVIWATQHGAGRRIKNIKSVEL